MTISMKLISACLVLLEIQGGKVITQRTQRPEKKLHKSYRQTLHNYMDMQYTADFNIGGQILSGIFDTGSSEVVVRSSRCSNCPHPTNPFRHELSSSFVEDGEMSRHIYGSGPCITMLGYDSVKVGPDMVADGQAIWEIVHQSIGIMDKARFAAIVGIGPRFGYSSTQKTLLMNFDVDEFSICLQKEPGSNGYLTWGPVAIEAMLHAGETITAKVYGKHHWATKMSMIGVANRNDEDNVDLCEDGCAAIIDSGASLLAGPRGALSMLKERIGNVNKDCSNLHTLPNLRFDLDGHILELPPSAYIVRTTGASLAAHDVWDLLFFKPKVRNLDVCMLGFMEMDMTTSIGQAWVFGAPFFRTYHSTFDRERQIMRFAKAGKDCNPEPLKASKSSSILSKIRNIISFSEKSDVTAYRPMDVDLSAVIPSRILIESSKNKTGIVEL